MSTYLELLETKADEWVGKDCGLGKILANEGKEKYDDVLEAIFAKGKKSGKYHPISRLVEVFNEEYGWTEFFFRRHRNGKCVSCLNR